MNSSLPYLDRTDRAIVALLQKDARMSNKEIASRVGVAQSTCSERIRRLDRTGVLRDYAEQIPEVVAFYHMAGADDFLVHVIARDSDHLRDIAMDAFSAQPEVTHIETSIIFEHTRFLRLPDEDGEAGE